MKLRIRGLFALGMGVICVLAGILAATEILREAARYRQTRAGVQVVDVFAAGLVTLEKLVGERSPTTIMLGAGPSVDAAKQANLTKARETADRGVADFQRMLEADASPYQADGLALIRQIAGKLSAARAVVDRAGVLADPPARALAARDAIGQMLAVTADFTPLLNEIQRSIAETDPESLPLSDAARIAVDLRDAAGQLGAKLGAAISAGRSFGPEESLSVEHVRGEVDTLAHLLSVKTASVAGAPELATAMATAQSRYLDQALETIGSLIVSARGDGHYALAYADFGPMNVSAMSTIYGVRDAALRVAVDRSSARGAGARDRLLLALGLMLLIIGAVAAVTILFRRRLVTPLIQLTGVIVEIAQGAREIAIPHIRREDEIGEIAGALGTLLESARTADRLAEERQAEGRAKQIRGERLDALTREFETSVASLVRTLAGAATGMAETASALSATAEETSGRSATVSTASEQTSHNVQTVAAATEELSLSIGEISRQVGESASIAARAVEDARQTDGLVRMLAERAQKIGNVVNLISSIAGQTNLLALNATIEAARAGDAGKGFAVVASEVKNLAGQTNRATDEITAQVSEIQTATVAAVSAIETIAMTIARIDEIAAAIAAAVEEQGAATAEIARNVQEAARSTQEVSSNIGGVRQAVEQTGAAAGNVLAAAGLLSQQAETLRGEVEDFVAAVKTA